MVLFARDQLLERTKYMNQNQSTEAKELTPITEKQEEGRGIAPLDKKEDATGDGNTIFGGIQKWLWGFTVSLPSTPGLETTTKAVELIVSPPTLPPVAPTRLPPRLIGQIRMPRFPFIPRIVENGRTSPLSGLPLVIQSARAALDCPLVWLLLGTFVGNIGLLHTLAKEPATSRLPSCDKL